MLGAYDYCIRYRQGKSNTTSLADREVPQPAEIMEHLSTTHLSAAQIKILPTTLSKVRLWVMAVSQSLYYLSRSHLAMTDALSSLVRLAASPRGWSNLVCRIRLSMALIYRSTCPTVSTTVPGSHLGP